MKDDLLAEGIELMVFGMGTVFVFLAVLIVVTVTMSTIVQKFFPDAPEPTMANTPRPAVQPVADDAQILAVITAAVHKFRSRK